MFRKFTGLAMLLVALIAVHTTAFADVCSNVSDTRVRITEIGELFNIPQYEHDIIYEIFSLPDYKLAELYEPFVLLAYSANEQHGVNIRPLDMGCETERFFMARGIAQSSLDVLEQQIYDFVTFTRISEASIAILDYIIDAYDNAGIQICNDYYAAIMSSLTQLVMDGFDIENLDVSSFIHEYFYGRVLHETLSATIRGFRILVQPFNHIILDLEVSIDVIRSGPSFAIVTGARSRILEGNCPFNPSAFSYATWELQNNQTRVLVRYNFNTFSGGLAFPWLFPHFFHGAQL